jgi:nucleotide-binding universal stress UspA family protein
MGVYRHIVVGVDGSDASARAADMAGRLALDLDAKLTVVFVRQLPAVAPSPFAMTMDLDNYWSDQERLASSRAAGVLDGLGAAWRIEVRTGDPAVQLERAAEENGADLIVVGRPRPLGGPPAAARVGLQPTAAPRPPAGARRPLSGTI